MLLGMSLGMFGVQISVISLPFSTICIPMIIRIRVSWLRIIINIRILDS